jgi:MFS family permease
VLAPQVLLSLFVGKFSDEVSRVKLLGFACLAWSASTYLAGTVDDYDTFVAMRVTLGIFSSAATVPAIGLIRDLFPANF